MKTIKIKKIVTLLCLVMLFANLLAQTEDRKKNICNSYMKAANIFEGKIIFSKYITLKTGEHTYYNFYSYLMQVQKVIKGNIHKGTIEMVGYAPGITYKGDDHMEGSPGPIDYPDLYPPGEGIYFTKAEEHRKDSNVANTNSKSLPYWDAIPLSKGELTKQSGGITDYFSTLVEFYDYISKNYGVKIDSAK